LVLAIGVDEHGAGVTLLAATRLYDQARDHPTSTMEATLAAPIGDGWPSIATTGPHMGELASPLSGAPVSEICDV
jgi:hypothetical protein